ncbi:MAG: extracellular solute-binding protein [Acidimicrobiales bacterium]|jgi:multiple sugar transport system substrate-binding protein
MNHISKNRQGWRRFIKPLIAVATVASCATTTAVIAAPQVGASSPVTITYLTHWGPTQVNMLKADAAAFHKINPNITVDFQAVPFGNLLSTIDTQGPSGNGWTIAGVYDLWLPALVNGGLAASAPSADASDVKANWPANLVADVTKSGAVRGFPNEVDLYALNYNKALFKAAGIAQPPANWTELVTDAKKLTIPSKGQQGFGVITDWAAGVVHPWLSLVDSDGGSLLTGLTPNLKSRAPMAASNLYAELVKAGSTVATMSTANAETTGPYLDNFTSGKTAMIIMANWWEADLQSAMGSKFSDIGTAPIPIGPNGTKSSSVSYSWLTIVNGKANSAKQAAAWEFLQYLNGPKSGTKGSSAMGDALISMGILPSRLSDVTAHKAQLNSPFLKTYVSELPNATPFPTVLGGEQMTDTLQTAIESIDFGQASPAAAMQSAQSQISSILKSANR